jgi:microcystin degradation protein MlrC
MEKIMRLLLAMFKHETNTFSPVPTPFERFFRRTAGILNGGTQAVDAYRGTGSGLGGFIEVADRLGAEIVLPVAAEAWPSGPVEDGAYQQISKLILDEVSKGGFDGILLDLHGAMVTQTLEDGEGTLLKRLREIDPTTPVGVTLDMHANMYDDVVKYATVVTGYHTYPHVDVYEAGRRAADLVTRTIAGQVKPVMAWGNRPMLPHIMRQGTHSEPNKSLQAKCVSFEAEMALSASLFTGFPHADVDNAGVSAVVCTDNDPALARKLCDELLDQAWGARERFVFRHEPLQQSVARAKQMTQGPVVLLDHCDNTASGGTMDTTVVLAEVLRQGLENVAFYAIYDPQAAALAAKAGVGARLALALGGKMPMPALREVSRPIQVSGTVKFIFDGRYRNHGPMARGTLNDTGTTVVLDTGKVEIVIVSRHQEPNDINCLQSAGIDPMQKHYIVLKSRVHWRAGLGNIAREVVECDGLGVATSDYSQFEFHNVRRPIYPLNPM